MVCVGIDVAKDKHDCCILDSDGTIRADCITIPNNMDGFKQLLQTIRDCTKKSDKIKVGLEATGHYSYNILGFLLDNDLAVYVMNPLHTNLYRKSLSLRKKGGRQFIGLLPAHADGQAALRVSIHQQNAFAGACKSHAEIDCGRRLADAALLIRDGDHLTVFHGVSSFL